MELFEKFNKKMVNFLPYAKPLAFWHIALKSDPAFVATFHLF